MTYVFQKVLLSPQAPVLSFIDKNLLGGLNGITSTEVDEYNQKLQAVFALEEPFGVGRHMYVWDTPSSEVIYFVALFDSEANWNTLEGSTEMEIFTAARGPLYLKAGWADLGYRIVETLPPGTVVELGMPVLTVAEAEAIWQSAV